jgi:DNA polymerase-4
MPERFILHVDMDAFFASVEQAMNPRLKGKPIAVTGSGKRTVITTASYEARKFGVKTGMTVWEGKRACPNLILVIANNRRYTYTSARIMEILKQYTPIVEIYSIDEAFLDISGSLALFDGTEKIANSIKKRIYDEFHITCTIGIAPNKLLAKLVSGLKKPNGLTIIQNKDISPLLENMPVKEMCGIGRKTEQKLAGYGIFTCGQLGRFPVKSLKKRFGVVGEYLHQMALGIDDSPVVPLEETADAKSIGHSCTLEKDIHNKEEIRRHILRLSEMVGRRARRYHYSGRTIALTLRYSDFSTITKRHTIKEYINHGLDIYQKAVCILETMPLNKPVRLVGVSISNMTKGYIQMNLFESWQKEMRAVAAMDEINDRFGEFTITYGRLLNCQKHSRVISPSYRPHGAHKIDVV